jgi:hypothetical protein
MGRDLLAATFEQKRKKQQSEVFLALTGIVSMYKSMGVPLAVKRQKSCLEIYPPQGLAERNPNAATVF